MASLARIPIDESRPPLREVQMPDVTVPEILQGILIPEGESAAIQERIDVLHQRIVDLRITDLHWMDKGAGIGVWNLDEVETLVGEMEQIILRRMPTIQTTAVPISPLAGYLPETE